MSKLEKWHNQDFTFHIKCEQVLHTLMRWWMIPSRCVCVCACVCGLVSHFSHFPLFHSLPTLAPLSLLFRSYCKILPTLTSKDRYLVPAMLAIFVRFVYFCFTFVPQFNRYVCSWRWEILAKKDGEKTVKKYREHFLCWTKTHRLRAISTEK